MAIDLHTRPASSMPFSQMMWALGATFSTIQKSFSFSKTSKRSDLTRQYWVIWVSSTIKRAQYHLRTSKLSLRLHLAFKWSTPNERHRIRITSCLYLYNTMSNHMFKTCSNIHQSLQPVCSKEPPNYLSLWYPRPRDAPTLPTKRVLTDTAWARSHSLQGRPCPTR